MSPKSGGRAQRRQHRLLLISVLVVVAISLGSFAAVVAAKWSPRLGLDLAGGVSVVYTAEGKNVSTADLNETVNILNSRVNGLGVSGAQVQATGNNQISVQIPGVKNAQQVLDQIGQTARLYFRPVECYAYPAGQTKADKGKPQPTRHREHTGLHVVERNHDVEPGRDSQQQYGRRLYVQQRAARTSSTSPIPRPAPRSPTTRTAPSSCPASGGLPGHRLSLCARTRASCRAAPSGVQTPRRTRPANGSSTTRSTAPRPRPARGKRVAVLGHGGERELPPAGGDRARRLGVLGADHPADAGELHLLRR